MIEKVENSQDEKYPGLSFAVLARTSLAVWRGLGL